MKEKKYFYGFRLFFDESTESGSQNKITGKKSIAGTNEVFLSEDDQLEWKEMEMIDYPCGQGGGKRVLCDLEKLRSFNMGLSEESFKTDLLIQVDMRYN
jgi:hypothetical protein